MELRTNVASVSETTGRALVTGLGEQVSSVPDTGHSMDLEKRSRSSDTGPDPSVSPSSSVSKNGPQGPTSFTQLIVTYPSCNCPQWRFGTTSQSDGFTESREGKKRRGKSKKKDKDVGGGWRWRRGKVETC